MIKPAYGSASLADLLPSIGTALGMSSPAAIPLPAASRYVLFLIDALGLDLLASHAGDAPYLSSLLDAPHSGDLTAGMPTTTATSLTSLGTGLPPGLHGVVGYTSRVPGTNRLLNALRWDKRVDAREWQPHPTAFSALARDGIETTVVGKRAFEQSGLTVAGQRGASYVGADSAGEQIAETLSALRGPRAMTYLYESDLDGTGHRDGVDSQAWRIQLATIDGFAERLREELPSDAVLLVTADHGMVDVDSSGRLDVDEEPELMDGVSLFGGEGRLRHLYCRAGAVGDVAAAWQARLGDQALVVTREQAIGDGWFGPQVDRAVEPRIGDVLVACLGPVAVVSSQRFPHEVGLIGLHGSLTRAEMMVPLLIDPGRA